MHKFYLLFMLLFAVATCPVGAYAAAEHVRAESPHQKIERTTGQILTLIKEAKGYYEKDPGRYFLSIEKIMDALIDFSSFTRSVMGPFGTKEYYASLKTQQERDAYKADYNRFVVTFRKGLINTYGKGMLAFNGQQVVISPMSDENKALVGKNEPVDVVQTISGDGNVYKVVYKMRPDKNGEWLLRNVIIGSVNVGSLYRNQFVASMDKYDNDFGKVIDNWVVEEAKIEAEHEKNMKDAEIK